MKTLIAVFLFIFTPTLVADDISAPLSHWTCPTCDVKAGGTPPEGEFLVRSEPPRKFPKLCYYRHGENIIIDGKQAGAPCSADMYYSHGILENTWNGPPRKITFDQ